MPRSFIFLTTLIVLFSTVVLAQTEGQQMGMPAAQPEKRKSECREMDTDNGISRLPVCPSAFGIVVDNSGTFRLALEKTIRLLTKIVDKKGERSEGFLMTYTDPTRIKVRQELTADGKLLLDEIENLFIEPGRTAVWDAIEAGARQLAEFTAEKPDYRRVLIIITDGDETGSSADPAKVFSLLRDEKIEVIAIGIAERRVSEKLIDRLVKETGGTKFVPVTPEDFEAVVAAVTEKIMGSR